MRRRLQARLKNTGQSPWFGYQTGVEDLGETRLRLDLVDATAKPVRVPLNYLYISGKTDPGDSAPALGLFSFPSRPGSYQAELRLTMAGREDQVNLPPLARFTVTVNPKSENPKADQ
jgi:hypothetical protein